MADDEDEDAGEASDPSLQCYKCQQEILHKDMFYQCDICCSHVHKACARLAPSESKCMPLQKRLLVFLCDNCLLIAKQIPLIVSMLEEIKGDLKLIQSSSLERRNAVVKQPKSYAEALGQGKAESIVIVKPKQKQAGSITKKYIRSHVDPSGLSVSTFREGYDGKVVIGCEDKKQIGTLKSRLKDRLGEKYVVEEPRLKNPKLKIININKDDVDPEDSDEDIVKEIVQCNNLINDGRTHIKILKKCRNKHGKVDLLLETDPKTHNVLLKNNKICIGWSRCLVFNHVSILQCYNCMGFGHFAKDCKSHGVCSICSSEDHSYKDCQSGTKKCVNCTKVSKDENRNADFHHSSLDRLCPIFLKMMEIENKKIDYLCESQELVK